MSHRFDFNAGNECHKEAGCATVSLFNQEGERPHTLRWGRTPESKKSTPQVQMTAEGTPRFRQAAQDIWRLTHLAWKAPQKELSVPMPLHLAHDLAEDRGKGKSLKHELPF